MLQYREASNAPEELSLSPKMLVHLARRPWWLLGLVAFVAGSGIQTAALSSTSLGVVEPALMATLLSALPLAVGAPGSASSAGESFRVSPGWLALEFAGAAVTVGGAYVLARSPLAVGAHRRQAATAGAGAGK